MADQPNVFNEIPPNTETPPVVTPPSVDKYADLLKSIKNENGESKYDNIEKALEALKHSQEYIPTLKTQLTEKEQELAILRAAKEKYENIDEVVQRLTARQPNGEENPPATRGLDEQAVADLVRRTLSQTTQESKANENLDKVQSVLLDKFKDKAPEVIRQKAQELGTTTKQLEDLAKQSPAMVLALFNSQVPTTAPVTTGNINTQPINRPSTDLAPPSKSLLAGASTKEQKDYMDKVKASVYAKHGITN
jgi:hypothetical protein